MRVQGSRLLEQLQGLLYLACESPGFSSPFPVAMCMCAGRNQGAAGGSERQRSFSPCWRFMLALRNMGYSAGPFASSCSSMSSRHSSKSWKSMDREGLKATGHAHRAIVLACRQRNLMTCIQEGQGSSGKEHIYLPHIQLM